MDNKLYWLFQENDKIYVCDRTGEVFYFYDLLKDRVNHKNKTGSLPIYGSVIGANLFPYILKAVNFPLFSAEIMNFFLWLLGVFLPVIAAAVFIVKLTNTYKTRQNFGNGVFKEYDGSTILRKAYKSRKIINRSLLFMVSMFVITSMIYFSNYEFMWLFNVGLSALSVSFLIGICRMRCNLVVKNITVDYRESYKVLKKLEKEGVF